MDFVRPPRSAQIQLVAGRGHYEAVIGAIRQARTSVWIATSNLKGLLVEDRRPTARRRGDKKRGYRSVLAIFDELAKRSVELRLLHATPPSRPFKQDLERFPELQKKLQLRQCPRVHLKAVVVDGSLLYLGSANWTGAGLGAKGLGRRNFELGILTDDEGLLDEVQGIIDQLWRGAECSACRLRAVCPMPLDELRARRSARKASKKKAPP